MAKENRMTREEYLAECEKVKDTAYAQQGNPTTYGNELLLQNINAVSYTHLTLPTISSV